MHNCKQSQDELIETALGGWLPPPDDLRECPHCQEELTSLRGAVEVTNEAMELVKPSEDFWGGYHTRLLQRLATESELPERWAADVSTTRLNWRRLFTVSVPVPAPLAFAVFAFIIFALGFMWQTRGAAPVVSSPNPSVVTQTVAVPLVQERVVTRVVYRERRHASSQVVQKVKSPQPAVPAQFAEGLAGFTPAHEPKLTIIKASYRDEK